MTNKNSPNVHDQMIDSLPLILRVVFILFSIPFVGLHHVVSQQLIEVYEHDVTYVYDTLVIRDSVEIELKDLPEWVYEPQSYEPFETALIFHLRFPYIYEDQHSSESNQNTFSKSKDPKTSKENISSGEYANYLGLGYKFGVVYATESILIQSPADLIVGAFYEHAIFSGFHGQGGFYYHFNGTLRPQVISYLHWKGFWLALGSELEYNPFDGEIKATYILGGRMKIKNWEFEFLHYRDHSRTSLEGISERKGRLAILLAYRFKK